jgi:16S rRNA (cytosine1402-N4)-methyltransferase
MKIESTGVHETVLLAEAIEKLITDASGVYVDATFGRGGHSQKISKALNKDGKLLAIDKDLVAIETAEMLFEGDTKFSIAHGSFADISRHLDERDMPDVHGVLADLGVSSPQLDNAARGFSFMNDGPLDMRMNTQEGVSAAKWLASVSIEELTKVLKEYGEEKYPGRIARAIVEEGALHPITTTLQLAKIVSDANPSWEKSKHPATRTFQAIRIKVNNELGDLEQFLEDASKRLRIGGRLVVISFHSLEDRIVKRFMRDKAKGVTPPPGVPIFEKDIVRNFKLVGKAFKPSNEEVERNVRSRSAVMRVLEKVADD